MNNLQFSDIDKKKKGDDDNEESVFDENCNKC
jgi:hypothetical protein